MKRVFVSYDYDNDAFLKEALVGQSKHEDSPFSLADWSVKAHLTGDWKEKARTKIRAVDLVVVICGLNTDIATGVAAEVQIAQEEKIPYFLLWGYNGKTCVKPVTALASDKIYKWEWSLLKQLIGGAR